MKQETKKVKHKPAYCSIKQCKKEAIRWFETQESETIYLCEDHNFYNDESNSDTLAIYSCSNNCEICN